MVTDVAVSSPSIFTLNGALPNVACPNCIPSPESAINTLLPLPNVNFSFAVSNSNLLAVKTVPVNANPPIEPDLNTALPLSSILADAFPTFAAVPAIVAGVNIELAATEPCIVTSLVITPPSNKKFEPVIVPFDFNTNPLELISVSSKKKPPIEPDLNTALPLSSILADAFPTLVATPAIVAGVSMELAATEPCIVTSLVIVPPLNSISEPVICPFDCMCKLLELTSMFPFEPLTNCPSPPKKKSSV